MNTDFWEDKKVFITGHTGFKGSWLSIWLTEMGAIVTGYSVDIPTNPSLFEEANLASRVNHILGDIRDIKKLQTSMIECEPDVVIHLAAQPLVRLSYLTPRDTYEVNVMGTVNVLEAVRRCSSVKSCVIITTDKCYENKEWVYGYRENEPMGGYDPYSSSKGAAELVTLAYIKSYFSSPDSPTISSARAGNVIGGGDWAVDRLIPDIVKSIQSGRRVKIRNPLATRPWQHVLEPLSGYILLAEKGYNQENVSGGWNFGPFEEDAHTVEWVADKSAEYWGIADLWEKDGDEHPHEATFLKLDISKARFRLKWSPRWGANVSIKFTIEWYKDFYSKKYTSDDLFDRCVSDINKYLTNSK